MLAKGQLTIANIDDGKSNITGLLTNEAVTLPANNTGTVSSFSSALGSFVVYDGTNKVSSEVAYSVASSSNITVNINAKTGAYSVTAMPTGTIILNGYATLKAVYNDVTIEKQLNVSKSVTGATGATGSTGATGASATSYWITASNNIIGKSQTGVINPTTITFKGFSKTGTANPVAYSGRFIIQTSTNGTAYTTRYTSSADQNTYTYTIPADSLFVKCLFYMAGGTTVLLDEQTVPIVETAQGIDIGGEQLLKNQSKDWTQKNLTINDWFFQEGSDYKVEVGQTYTFSVVVEKVSTDTVPIHLALGLGSSTGTYTWDFPGSIGARYGIQMGKRISITFTVSPTDGASGTHTYFAWRLRNEKKATSIKYKEVKLERGNIPTDWRPHPEDARTYKAWANSSDGTIDFTRVYPNENLLLESNQSVTTSTYNMKEYPLADDTLTATDDVVITIKGALGADRIGFIAHNSGGSSAIGGNLIHLGDGIYQRKAKWNPTGGSSFLRIYQVASTGTSSSTIEWIKLERGATPTTYTTNTADSLTGSVMQYIGFSPLDSNNPSEYEWIINPEYTKALSEESLTNKADKGEIDDINNALGDKVDNATFKGVQEIAEEFAQSYKAFVSDDGKHKKDLEELEKRIELMILDLGDKVLKLDFINSYMTAGSEGFLIGSKDSSIKMLLSNNSLIFVDGGTKVAEFSGQSFTIERGSILKDVQIGEHKVSKFGNGQTVFQWVQ